ncbi:MAG: YCF48-related protein [Bacteroidetes bacterium]|nr:YCF48-related protein [Bacteroidota bacterium]
MLNHLRATLLTIFLFMSICFHSNAQWFPISSPESNQITSICFPSTNISYLSSSSNIYKSTDGAITWDTLGYPFPTFTDTLVWSGRLKQHLFFTSIDTGFAAGWDLFANNELIMKTVDGGATWLVKHSAFTGGQLQSIYFPSSSIGYSVGLSGRKLKSTDGGQTWTALPSAGITETLNDVFFLTNTTGYIIGVNKNYKTINGGTTWRVVSLTGVQSIWFTDNMKGYAGNGNGSVLHTTDGGATWATVSLGESIPVNDIQFVNDSTGYITSGYGPGNPGKVFKTSDYGIHWEPQPSSIGVTLFDVCFIDENTGFAVGDNGTIIKTTNGGGPTAPVALFAGDNPLFCDSVTNFSNLGPVGYSYTWLINGVVTATSYNFSYAFAPSSTYTVSLIANNGLYSDTTTSTINTPAPLSINIILTANADTVCAPASATLNILSSQPGVYYRFMLGATYLTGNIAGTGGTLTYTSSGLFTNTTFTVEAVISTSCGIYTQSQNITIYCIPYPITTIPFAAVHNPICAGDSTVFTISSTQTDVRYWIVKYVSGLPAVSDTVLGTGGSIFLNVWGTGTFLFAAQKVFGCSPNYSSLQIAITQRTLNMYFYPSGTTYIANDTLAFNNSSNADSYVWQFPGAGISGSTNFEPTNITYPSSGIYNITLIGNTIEGCSDSTTAQVSIFNQAPNGTGTYCWSYNENASQSIFFPTYAGAYPFKTHSVSDQFIDNKGNVYVTGFYKQTVYSWDPKYNFFIRKLDKDGNLLWSKYMMAGNDNRELNSFVAGITGDTAGNIYLTGTLGTDLIDFGSGIILTCPSPSVRNTFVVKYNSNGDALWAQDISGGSYSTATDIVAGNKNDVYVSVIIGNVGYVIKHYDTNGNFINDLFVPTTTGQGIETIQSLNYSFVIGDQIPILSPKMRFDKNGDLLVAGRNYKGDLILGSTTIPCSSQEEVYFVGIIDTSSFTWSGGFPVARYKRVSTSWASTYLSSFLSFDIDSNNNIYFTGSWAGSNDTAATLVIGNDTISEVMDKYAFISKFNITGNLLWHNLAKANGIRDIVVASTDHAFIYGKIDDDIYSVAAGFYSQTAAPAGIAETMNSDYFLGEYNPSGDLVSVNKIMANDPPIDILQEGGILERNACGDLYFTALVSTVIIGSDTISTGTEQLTVTKFAPDNFCTKLFCTPAVGPVISAISSSSITEICVGDSIVFAINWASVGVSKVNISYSLNGAPFLPLVSNFPDATAPYYYTVADSGSYTFIITDSANVLISDTIYNMLLNPIPYPTIVVSNDTNICEGESATLNAIADMPVNYVWAPGTSTTSSVTYSPIASTQYTVTATNSTGCSSQDMIMVSVNPIPYITYTNKYH